MKISEMISLLQLELSARGDVEVLLHGAYGADSSTFDVMPDEHVDPKQRQFLNIYTDIMTG